jgi:hypothetical protein
MNPLSRWMPVSTYFYTLKVTKKFSGVWKFAKTVKLGSGGVGGCRPFITDKRCYWINCKYWGWPEIGWKEVKDWTVLQCGNQRYEKRINFVLQRRYEPQKCTWLRNHKLWVCTKVNNLKFSMDSYNFVILIVRWTRIWSRIFHIYKVDKLMPQKIKRKPLSPGVQWPGCEVDHSPPSSGEVKNVWSYTSTPPICFH